MLRYRGLDAIGELSHLLTRTVSCKQLTIWRESSWQFPNQEIYPRASVYALYFFLYHSVSHLSPVFFSPGV